MRSLSERQDFAQATKGLAFSSRDVINNDEKTNVPPAFCVSKLPLNNSAGLLYFLYQIKCRITRIFRPRQEGLFGMGKFKL